MGKRKEGRSPAAVIDLRPVARESIRLYYFTGKSWGLKALWEKRLKVSLYAEANDPFELLPFDRSTKAQRRVVDRELEKLEDAGHGVLCFSEAWTTSVLWTHYAERHAGMCLGFDVPVASTTKIEYIDQPLAVGKKLSTGDVAAALALKPAAWRHERERQVRVALETPVDGVHFRSFDDDLHLREVILGSRCPLLPHEIVDAVTNPPLDVDIFKARASAASFDVCKHEKVATHQTAGYRATLANARHVFADEVPED